MTSPVSLSILIPVFNWNVSPLLNSLYEQCSRLSEQGRVEIVVVDDGSSRKFHNASVAHRLNGVIYKELPENRGRAAVRNFLIQRARGSYVLFLDADMLPDQENFVSTYLELAGKGKDVVCGGISYQQNDYQDSASSFYIYKSMKTEALSAEKRNAAPWRYIFTSNIMLRRDILDSVSFDPRFTGYGFEDIEWGVRLAGSFSVEHIDNTCSHMGVLQKEDVFARMRESISNYILLFSLYPQQISSAGAIGLAKRLQYFPDFFLLLTDKLLAGLFGVLSWNRLLFLIFQCDKAVLLARALKKQALSQHQDSVS